MVYVLTYATHPLSTDVLTRFYGPPLPLPPTPPPLSSPPRLSLAISGYALVVRRLSSTISIPRPLCQLPRAPRGLTFLGRKPPPLLLIVSLHLRPFFQGLLPLTSLTCGSETRAVSAAVFCSSFRSSGTPL